MHIAVNQLQYDCLQEIAQETGKSVNQCLLDALDDYIRTIGPTIAGNNLFNPLTSTEFLHPTLVH